jgi:hypothetical protein
MRCRVCVYRLVRSAQRSVRVACVPRVCVCACAPCRLPPDTGLRCCASSMHSMQHAACSMPDVLCTMHTLHTSHYTHCIALRALEGCRLEARARSWRSHPCSYLYNIHALRRAARLPTPTALFCKAYIVRLWQQPAQSSACNCGDAAMRRQLAGRQAGTPARRVAARRIAAQRGAGGGAGAPGRHHGPYHTPHTVLALSIKCPEPADAFSANLVLGARQSIQCSAGEVLEQATCIRCSVLSKARALSAADCSQVISAHQNPMQESWGGVGVQVIARALPVWGMSKQLNAESPSIPNATAPNLTDGEGARSQSAGLPPARVPFLLSANSYFTFRSGPRKFRRNFDDIMHKTEHVGHIYGSRQQCPHPLPIIPPLSFHLPLHSHRDAALSAPASIVNAQCGAPCSPPAPSSFGPRCSFSVASCIPLTPCVPGVYRSTGGAEGAFGRRYA